MTWASMGLDVISTSDYGGSFLSRAEMLVTIEEVSTILKLGS